MRSSLAERFRAKVARDSSPTGCHVWVGARHPQGYGHISNNGKTIQAHHAALLIDGITVPPDMEVDHLCKNTSCVNRAHLDVVTPAVNNARSNSVAALNSRKTHCVNGHALTGANVRVDPRSGSRICKACNRAAVARRARRRKHG